MAAGLVVQPPRVIGDERQLAVMTRCREPTNIRGRPVVAGREDQRPTSVWLGIEHGREIAGQHAQRDLELTVVPERHRSSAAAAPRASAAMPCLDAAARASAVLLCAAPAADPGR